VTLRNSTCQENEAGASGGAIALDPSYGRLSASFTGVDVLENRAGEYGGGVAVRPLRMRVGERKSTVLSLSVSGGRFEGNHAKKGDGGGLHVEGLVEESQRDTARVEIFDVRFLGNTAGGRGGGLFLGHVLERLILRGVTVQTNTAAGGGGLHLEKSRAWLWNCTVVGNRARDLSKAGGISWTREPPSTDHDTRVADNDPSDQREDDSSR
jgi:hypothetical protein